MAAVQSGNRHINGGATRRAPAKRRAWPLESARSQMRISTCDMCMEESPMSRRLLIGAGIILLSVSAARAQGPSPEAMTAARSLVTTMKLAEAYKDLLPGILLGLKPALVQDRPDVDRDFDAMMPEIKASFAPYY